MNCKLFLCAVVLSLLSSCYYDNEEDLYPKEDVNNKEVTYSKNIEPIINNNCATSGCHVPGGNGQGLLVTYDQVRAIALNGKLKNRVIDRMDMPSSQPLPAREMDMILTWINQGAPNN